MVPPSGPWNDCAINLLGPLPSGESILVIVDYFGRFFEIAILKSVTSDEIICALRPNFACFGLPISLKNSDIGKPNLSLKFGLPIYLSLKFGYRKFVLTQNFFTKKFAIEIGKASFAAKNTQIYAGKLRNQQSKSVTQC